MRRKCVGNKVAGVFSCGQRDLCHLSEAQPQAGNRTKYAVKYGIKRRNNTSKKWGKVVDFSIRPRALKASRPRPQNMFYPFTDMRNQNFSPISEENFPKGVVKSRW